MYQAHKRLYTCRALGCHRNHCDFNWFFASSMQKARQAAVVTQCLSNLRQWGIAIYDYSDTNKGSFLQHGNQYMAGTLIWKGGVPGYAQATLMVQKYRMTPGMFYCPSDTVYNPLTTGSNYYWDPTTHNQGPITSYLFLMGDMPLDYNGNPLDRTLSFSMAPAMFPTKRESRTR